MSAREPFAEHHGETMQVCGVLVPTGGPDCYAANVGRVCAAINAAHADRVAAELEAAADDATEESQSSPMLSPKCVAAWLRARAKAIREGGVR